MLTKYNIAVFVSGGGTDLQAIIDSINSGYIKNAKIAVVIGSKEGIFALERAKKENIPTAVYKKSDYDNPEKRFGDIIVELEQKKIDLIVLAGYLLILSPNIYCPLAFFDCL